MTAGNCASRVSAAAAMAAGSTTGATAPSAEQPVRSTSIGWAWPGSRCMMSRTGSGRSRRAANRSRYAASSAAAGSSPWISSQATSSKQAPLASSSIA